MSASVAIRSQWTNVVGGFLFTVPLVVAIRDHVVSVSRVEGESMQVGLLKNIFWYQFVLQISYILHSLIHVNIKYMSHI